MGVDPKKMAAWASKDNGQEMKPQGGGGPGHGHAKHEDPEEGDDHEEHDDEEHGHEEEDEDSGKGKGMLIAALEEFSDEAEQSADEVDGDDVTDPEAELSDEDHKILQDGYNALPPKLKKAIQRNAKDISMDEATEIAEHLHEEDKVEDPDRLAGWLYRVGQIV